jgi:hypothetical protein
VPLPSNLSDMMEHLEREGFLNLDTPLRVLVEPETINAASPNALPTDVIIGPRYVFVTIDGPELDIAQISRFADAIRTSAGARVSDQ